ncbi:extracellular solute-binding protein [Cohnella fermenti]|nr:extracellular solute-binding protein [Cohnella fermenti]
MNSKGTQSKEGGNTMTLKRWTLTMMTTGLIGSMLLTACSGNNEGKSVGNSQEGTAPPASAGSASIASGGDGTTTDPTAEPLGKYDPPIKLTSARGVDSTYKYEAGDDLEHNVWTRAYQDDLGIDFSYDWTVAAAQYDEKLNIAIASGDLPDMFTVNATQLKNLVDAGQIADLTSSWDQYATDYTKQIVTEDGGHSLQSATFNGKVYAIPNTLSAVDTASVLWVRTDWLTKLGLSEPQSLQDVLTIAKAFATQDPDGNGKQDTYGLAVHKNLWDGWAGLEGFFNAYGAYPQIWVRDEASGQLAFGTVQPAMKQALADLQNLYETGAIDPEFGVKDPGKEGELADKFGLFFGKQWAPISPLQAAKNLDPEMDWKAFPIYDLNGQPTKSQAKFPVQSYTVVRKGYEHPEAAVKLANLFADKMFGPDMEPSKYGTTADNIEVFHAAVAQIWPNSQNQEAQASISAALNSNDPSSLTPALKSTYDNIVKFRNGDNSTWAFERIFGPVSSQSVLNQYLEQNLLQNNEFFGAPTPMIGSKQSSLDKMTLENLTKIIMGDASVDDFDTYVKNWSNLGGADITNEVNEWYAAQ